MAVAQAVAVTSIYLTLSIDVWTTTVFAFPLVFKLCPCSCTSIRTTIFILSSIAAACAVHCGSCIQFELMPFYDRRRIRNGQ